MRTVILGEKEIVDNLIQKVLGVDPNQWATEKLLNEVISNIQMGHRIAAGHIATVYSYINDIESNIKTDDFMFACEWLTLKSSEAGKPVVKCPKDCIKAFLRTLSEVQRRRGIEY